MERRAREGAGPREEAIPLEIASEESAVAGIGGAEGARGRWAQGRGNTPGDALVERRAREGAGPREEAVPLEVAMAEVVVEK